MVVNSCEEYIPKVDGLFVNRQFWEGFYTTFMKNIKKVVFIFFHKNFLKIFTKSTHLEHPLTFLENIFLGS